MPELHTLTVASEMRLDQLLADHWEELDRTTIRDLVTAGDISINGLPARTVGQRLRPDDQVIVRLPELEESAEVSLPLGLSLPVVYEDDELLVVDKPAGISVRRLRKPGAATVPELLAARYPDLANVGGVDRAGVVTTLGEDASGLILAGKDEASYRELRKLVKRQHVGEVYTALVEGHLRGEFTIDQPIGNAKRVRQRLVVSREGRPARTLVRGQQHFVESGQHYTLVYVRPETSRMHQIRVHLAWYGFPIVGDRAYGSTRRSILPGRIFLHMSELSLPHPTTGEEVRVASPLPPELYSVLTYMRRPK